jgi:hypothetical protein
MSSAQENRKAGNLQERQGPHRKRGIPLEFATLDWHRSHIPRCQKVSIPVKYVLELAVQLDPVARPAGNFFNFTSIYLNSLKST